MDSQPRPAGTIPPSCQSGLADAPGSGRMAARLAQKVLTQRIRGQDGILDRPPLHGRARCGQTPRAPRRASPLPRPGRGTRPQSRAPGTPDRVELMGPLDGIGLEPAGQRSGPQHLGAGHAAGPALRALIGFIDDLGIGE